MALSWSAVASIVYFCVYTGMMILLAMFVWKKEDHNLDKTFLKSVWIQRKIYAQVIVHFYDTATDIGVLITWYLLHQDDNDYKNVDMAVFFYAGCAILLLYRFISIFVIIYQQNTEGYNDWRRTLQGICIRAPLALLDLFMLEAVYQSFKSAQDIIEENIQRAQEKRDRLNEKAKRKKDREKSEKTKLQIEDTEPNNEIQEETADGTDAVDIDIGELQEETGDRTDAVDIDIGELQEETGDRTDAVDIDIVELQDIDPAVVQEYCMLAEATFESIFLIRSVHDPMLRHQSNNALIFASIIVSIFSVANKFYLMDKRGVEQEAQSLKP
eukprot:118079_1